MSKLFQLTAADILDAQRKWGLIQGLQINLQKQKILALSIFEHSGSVGEKTLLVQAYPRRKEDELPSL